MILRRLGNKQQVADKILPYFPPHKIYVEPFFGAGGMFFSKGKAKYNIVNDIDSDVFNLFTVLIDRREDLLEAFKLMPIHEDLLKYWKKKKEKDPIKKALRFLLLSNFTLMGKQSTIRSDPNNSKEILLKDLLTVNDKLFNLQFFNKDFRKFLKVLCLDQEKRQLVKDTFIYADGPYLDTINTYEMLSPWKEKDSADLFEALQATECKFAMSEFDHPFIIDQATKRGLNIIFIGERTNLKNKRVEILITNYHSPQYSIDF